MIPVSLVLNARLGRVQLGGFPLRPEDLVFYCLLVAPIRTGHPIMPPNRDQPNLTIWGKGGTDKIGVISPELARLFVPLNNRVRVHYALSSDGVSVPPGSCSSLITCNNCAR